MKKKRNHQVFFLGVVGLFENFVPVGIRKQFQPLLIRGRKVQICTNTTELKNAIENFDQLDRFLIGKVCEETGESSIKR